MVIDTALAPPAPPAGESEAGLRGVFAAARALAPAVVFIDEIDALAPARGGGGAGGGDDSAGVAGALAGAGWGVMSVMAELRALGCVLVLLCAPVRDLGLGCVHRHAGCIGLVPQGQHSNDQPADWAHAPSRDSWLHVLRSALPSCVGW